MVLRHGIAYSKSYGRRINGENPVHDLSSRMSFNMAEVAMNHCARSYGIPALDYTIAHT
jgi:hypothetical protein